MAQDITKSTNSQTGGIGHPPPSPPTEYQDRFVVFLDVLGWRDLIKRSEKDQTLIPKMGGTLNLLKFISQQAEEFEVWFSKAMEAQGRVAERRPDDIQFSQLSDSIVISTVADGWGRDILIQEVLKISRILLDRNELLLRGGLTKGAMYHKGPVAFGPALTAAYDLEQKAIYPRVILDPALNQEFLKSQQISLGGKPAGHFRLVRRSSDGFCFLDFLSPMGAVAGNIPIPRFPKQFLGLDIPRKVIKEALGKHPHASRIWQKYRWLADYFNEVAAEYPDMSVQSIDYMPDPGKQLAEV